ncbi:unnamed protein product [Symbiodinium sp. KB8]|nr:unnamed protein product [Symbiodinium sp. KB8]
MLVPFSSNTSRTNGPAMLNNSHFERASLQAATVRTPTPCTKEWCVFKDEAVYINNCQWGLHGPIEVFSRRCIAMYIAGLPICQNLLFHAWGEDIFIDQCMMELGLTRVNEFDVMSEIACGDQPAPCGQTDTTFHPFKNVPVLGARALFCSEDPLLVCLAIDIAKDECNTLDSKP